MGVAPSTRPCSSGAWPSYPLWSWARGRAREGPRLTVRLPVQSGDTMVRLKLRPWASYQTTVSTTNLSVVVAVPGGALVRQTMVRSVPLGTMVMSGAATVWMGDVLSVELALPSGGPSEIVVDLGTVRDPPNCGLQPTAPGYLVDDLRVE
jgi:hypothetical protein